LDKDSSTPARRPASLPRRFNRVGLGVLARFVPAGLVDEVLVATGRMQQRVRLIPSRMGIWFVLGLSLYAHEAYREVWRQLAAGTDLATPSSPALTEARRRLGVAPLRRLFARVRGPQAAAGTPGAFFAGLRLVAWDGSMLDVADSKPNRAAFIRPRNQKTTGGYPQVRLLKLIEVGTHAVIDAVFGTCSEQKLARDLIGSLTPGMLLLADRNFPGYQLWKAAAGTGAQLLWRVKTATFLPRLATYTDGSYLALLPAPGSRRRRGIWVRVIEYTITVTSREAHGRLRTRTELVRLVTTLLDPNQASAQALAQLYSQRWESETGYQSLKVTQRGPRRVLRSRDPAGVRQEIYSYLVTYQATRQLMAEAAAGEGVDTDRLSFITALRVIRRLIGTLATSGRRLRTALGQAITEILDQQTERRSRTSPRAVKRPVSPYPSKRNANPPTTAKASYTVTVIDAAAGPSP
jgi:hypothetical protein